VVGSFLLQLASHSDQITNPKTKNCFQSTWLCGSPPCSQLGSGAPETRPLSFPGSGVWALARSRLDSLLLLHDLWRPLLFRVWETPTVLCPGRDLGNEMGGEGRCFCQPWQVVLKTVLSSCARCACLVPFFEEEWVANSFIAGTLNLLWLRRLSICQDELHKQAKQD
jgi:hypothetical protein